jgi:hypothetical protein
MISESKAPGIIKFSWADEALRTDTLYHTCSLGANIVAAARIPFPAHRQFVVAAHRRVAAERCNIRTWRHDHCKAIPPACAR